MPQPSANQFSGIFICYRRDDCPGHAGRLFDKLVDHFGSDQIFMDVDSIEPGEDFVEVIETALGSCAILLAMIGSDWISTDEKSRPLYNVNDYVRLEIGTALRRNVRVIPVLVEGATMPRPDELPEELVPLSRRNSIELSDIRWPRDVAQLVSHLEKILSSRQTRIAEAEAMKGSAGAAASDPARVQPVAGTTTGAEAGSERDEAVQPVSPNPPRPIMKVVAVVAMCVVLLLLGLLAMQSRRLSPDNDNAPPTPSPTVEITGLTAEENAARGRELTNQRKYVEAEPYWRAAVDKSEFNAEYNNQLGVALFFQKRYIDAEPFLRKAVALDSGNAQYKADVGNVLGSQAKYAEAEAFHQEVARLLPNDGDHINNLGIDLYFLKRYAEAEASFRKAISLKPNDPEIYNNLGNALFSQGRYAEARIQYREALKRDENNPTFQRNVDRAPTQ